MPVIVHSKDLWISTQNRFNKNTNELYFKQMCSVLNKRNSKIQACKKKFNNVQQCTVHLVAWFKTSQKHCMILLSLSINIYFWFKLSRFSSYVQLTLVSVSSYFLENHNSLVFLNFNRKCRILSKILWSIVINQIKIIVYTLFPYHLK